MSNPSLVRIEIIERFEETEAYTEDTTLLFSEYKTNPKECIEIFAKLGDILEEYLGETI